MDSPRLSGLFGLVKKMNDITGIMVCYNTKHLVERAYNSVRKFYPDMPIIIVDGSDRGNPCVAYVSSLTTENTSIIHPGRNVGHGQGMCMGITQAKTRYALIFDSDIQMISDCVPAMLEKMEENTFGIGAVVQVDLSGNGTKSTPAKKRSAYWLATHRNLRRRYGQRGLVSTPYLHPYFHLINIQNYKKYKPYAHHGAPCLSTMYDIYKRGLSKTVLVNFPDLKECVKHDGRGTRKDYGSELRQSKQAWQAIR